MTDKFESLNPATGDVVGVHPIDGPDEVAAAVARARSAADWWADLGFKGREKYLLDWRTYLQTHLDELAELSHQETGKPINEATFEAILGIDHLHWATKNAKKVLGPRRVDSGLFMFNQASSVEYRPLGVVGVIGPWNYPVFTPLGSIAYALAAGNAVVFKPSEYTPGVGKWLADAFAQVVDRPVFQLVTGLGATGAALCAQDIDKLAFTGSTATGKKVMAACAEKLIPVVIEAGGKDVLLVDEDANLQQAADGALWSGFSNAGQTCVGTERVYVHEKVYDAFLTELLAQASELRAGWEDGAQFGPITMPSQIDIIRSHIDDALAKGATAVLGGADAVGERFVQPTILTNVPEDSLAITTETFGPTLTVNKVRDMDEAVERANAIGFGLAGAVFSGKQGPELARRIRSGMTSVNAVMSFAAIPDLPFGGVGQSGFGRIHGADGLREFTYAKAITRQRFTPPVHLTTFQRTPEAEPRFRAIADALFGAGLPTREALKKAGIKVKLPKRR